MLQPKMILIDVDGTLVDSVPDVFDPTIDSGERNKWPVHLPGNHAGQGRFSYTGRSPKDH